MRPTFSIILFTVLSGAGYGLLFIVGLSLLSVPSLISSLTLPGSNAIETFTVDLRLTLELALATGALLTIAGLLCSVGHLGKPMRAWRAFSQWRTSWLSREGVASLLTFVPTFGLLVSMLCGLDIRSSGALLGGAALSCLSAITVFCTARIYSSLKPVRAWNSGYVVPVYLLLACYTGALWTVALFVSARVFSPVFIAFLPVFFWNAILIAPLTVGLKVAYWRSLAKAAQPLVGDATGLAHLGSVRSFEQPHTEENYLTHEMGFVLARKHSRRLRMIASALILLSPLAAIPLTFVFGDAAWWLVVLLGMLGVFVERWLFFAEARHTVIAFYGR